MSRKVGGDYTFVGVVVGRGGLPAASPLRVGGPQIPIHCRRPAPAPAVTHGRSAPQLPLSYPAPPAGTVAAVAWAYGHQLAARPTSITARMIALIVAATGRPKVAPSNRID